MGWSYTDWYIEPLREYGWINLYLDDLSDIPIGLIGVGTMNKPFHKLRNNMCIFFRWIMIWEQMKKEICEESVIIWLNIFVKKV